MIVPHLLVIPLLLSETRGVHQAGDPANAPDSSLQHEQVQFGGGHHATVNRRFNKGGSNLDHRKTFILGRLVVRNSWESYVTVHPRHRHTCQWGDPYNNTSRKLKAPLAKENPAIDYQCDKE